MKISEVSHKKQGYLIAGAFLLFCIVVLLLTLIQKNMHVLLPGTGSPTPTPVSSNTVILSPTPDIRSAGLSLLQSSPTSFLVNMDTGGKDVTGVQLALSFDPRILQNVTIKAGYIFTNPVVLTNKINMSDKTTATLFYAVVSPPDGKPFNGKGVAAIISYTVNPGVSSTTVLTFEPQTKIMTQGVGGQSILKQASGITLDLSPTGR